MQGKRVLTNWYWYAHGTPTQGQILPIIFYSRSSPGAAAADSIEIGLLPEKRMLPVIRKWLVLVHIFWGMSSEGKPRDLWSRFSILVRVSHFSSHISSQKNDDDGKLMKHKHTNTRANFTHYSSFSIHSRCRSSRLNWDFRANFKAQLFLLYHNTNSK